MVDLRASPARRRGIIPGSPTPPDAQTLVPIPTHPAAVALLGLAAAACVATQSAPTEVIRAKFACDGARTIAAEFVNAPPTRVRLTLSDGRVLTLPQAISASGARYASPDERVVFWNKGDTAFLEEGGKPTFTGCLVER